jgi:hypothetical protein
MSGPSPQPSGKTPRRKPKHALDRHTLARIAALVFGVLAVVAFVQLQRAPSYAGGAALVVTLAAAVVGGVIARSEDIRLFLQLLWVFLAGACATAVCYSILAHINSGRPLSALSYIDAVGGSNMNVGAYGVANFSVTIPSGYSQLTVAFSVANSPEYDYNCVNGSQESISPSYGTTLGQILDIPSGATDTISIPPGVTSLKIAVQFEPQNGYTTCHEDITVAAAQFAS